MRLNNIFLTKLGNRFFFNLFYPAKILKGVVYKGRQFFRGRGKLGHSIHLPNFFNTLLRIGRGRKSPKKCERPLWTTPNLMEWNVFLQIGHIMNWNQNLLLQKIRWKCLYKCKRPLILFTHFDTIADHTLPSKGRVMLFYQDLKCQIDSIWVFLRMFG